MSAVTIFRIHLVTSGPLGSRSKDSEYSNLDSAVERVKWLMRRYPGCRVTLDVVPPVQQHKPDDFEQRLTEALRTPLGTPAEQSRLAARTSYQIGDMGRAIDEAALISSWEREHGEDEPNPFLTLAQKRTDEHHRVVEQAAEEALQGGEYGVRVDVYPTRTVARVDPTVPYGCKVEHQHLTDPQERA